MYCDSIKLKSKSNIITIFIFGSVQNYQNIMVWEGGGVKNKTKAGHYQVGRKYQLAFYQTVSRIGNR